MTRTTDQQSTSTDPTATTMNPSDEETDAPLVPFIDDADPTDAQLRAIRRELTAMRRELTRLRDERRRER
ncbi:hypothetical protein ACNS7O_02045 [Haloferacaceae archaeon DSL9]